MKNNENTKLLDHKRAVDAERRAQAILRKEAQRRANLAAMYKVGGAK